MCNLPDFLFSLSSGTINDLVRLILSDRRRIERIKASGIRENFGVSGALRSGKKKFFTANIVLRFRFYIYFIFGTTFFTETLVWIFYLFIWVC